MRTERLTLVIGLAFAAVAALDDPAALPAGHDLIENTHAKNRAVSFPSQPASFF